MLRRPLTIVELSTLRVVSTIMVHVLRIEIACTDSYLYLYSYLFHFPAVGSSNQAAHNFNFEKSACEVK